MIEVEKLTKRYGRQTAVDDISFKVDKGEILGFLGPNGAGKTTTMRILAGYLPPTEGRAKVAGFDVFENPLSVKKRVGYAPETPPLYPDLDVDSFLNFCARIKGIDKANRKHHIEDAIEKAGVGDVRRKLIGRLSKGYKQRVGIAQAILGTPQVLILDEPTAGLDPKQITEIRELIKGLGGDHTVVLSTHILPEVAMTCSRVLIINKGRVVAEDTPDNLSHRLRGSRPVRLEVRGGTGPVFEAIRNVPGIANVRPVAGGVDYAAFDIEAEAGRDIRAELSRAVIQGGFDLLALAQSGLSLEDVFLQLTTEDASATAAVKEAS